MDKILTVKAIKQMVSESSNEFKAVLGPNVEEEDKKNNGKAYSDAKKRAKDYDGGLEKEMLEDKPKFEKVDDNRTTLDYNPANATDAYRRRVHAQGRGYASEQEMNNGIEKAGDYSDNENIYQGIKKAGQKLRDNEKILKKSGLQAREWPDSVFDREEMYESKDGADMRQMIDAFKSHATPTVLKEHVKTVYFKKTTFLSEDHMKSRIPDEFKKEGEQFKMKDKTGNEYLMEWKNNDGKILAHVNGHGMVESLDRMKNIIDYKGQDTETTRDYRMNEGNEALIDTLNKMRKIIK